MAEYNMSIAARESLDGGRTPAVADRMMRVNCCASSEGSVNGGRRRGNGIMRCAGGGPVAGTRSSRGKGSRVTICASMAALLVPGCSGGVDAAGLAVVLVAFARASASACASALPNCAALPRSPAFAFGAGAAAGGFAGADAFVGRARSWRASAFIFCKSDFILTSSSLLIAACLANHSCKGRVMRRLLYASAMNIHPCSAGGKWATTSSNNSTSSIDHGCSARYFTGSLGGSGGMLWFLVANDGIDSTCEVEGASGAEIDISDAGSRGTCVDSRCGVG